MPVEECGNLLIVCTVICRLDGTAQFAERYRPRFRQAQYLAVKGFDPKISFALMILCRLPWLITAICR